MQLVADDMKNLEALLAFSFGLHARTGCISIILGYRQRGEEQSLLQRWCPFSQTSILKIFRHSLFEEYIFQKHVFANVFFIQVDNRLVKRKLEKKIKKKENSQRKVAGTLSCEEAQGQSKLNVKLVISINVSHCVLPKT